MKAFSVELFGDMAFFKKNDMNDMIYMSYNFIHRPVILGIFGAIAGFRGYAQSDGAFPEYYEKFKGLKIAVRPHYIKPLKKAITVFNNASGMASKDGALQVREQVLVGEPEIRYTVFVLYNEDDQAAEKLKNKLKDGLAVYLPYFGKNEFPASFENFREHENIEEFNDDSYVEWHSILLAEAIETKSNEWDDIDFFSEDSEEFAIYENLPVDFDQNGYYRKELMVWTNRKAKPRSGGDFYKIGDKSLQFF